ncbi:MAG: NAD(P) transhydrogenase subunit alpha [Gemmataceae bacterium]
MTTRIGVPLQPADELRVALVPAAVAELVKKGLHVVVERGAGQRAGYPDPDFEKAGCRLVDPGQASGQADWLVTLRHVDPASLKQGQVVIGLLDPLGNPGRMHELAMRGVDAFALELLPRITRAQAMDALTSMASVAGYKAVLVAAARLDKMFPLQMTPAGTVAPARVLVVGAGVAGLQAIATAHRLGAVVSAYDVRPAVKEQVESVGGKFLELGLPVESAEQAGGYARQQSEAFYQQQQARLTEAVAQSDVVIATALVPGQPAPLLISADMVRGMRPGAIVIDLAAENGGNCALTRAGTEVVVHGVTVLGPLQLAATVPFHASQLYGKNLAAFLLLLHKAGRISPAADDEILRETLVACGGEVIHPAVRAQLAAAKEN